MRDGIHALGFLERHLIILTRLTAYVWDLTDHSLVSEITLPSLNPLSPPPPPQLAVNLSNSTFAICTPVHRHADGGLPPHPHRDYTSRLQVHQVSPAKPLYTLTLRCLILSLLAQQRGYLTVDVSASIHSIRPPFMVVPTALTTREDSLAASDDAEQAENDPVEIKVNGRDARTPLAPRLVPEQKLAEVLEYGGSAEAMCRGKGSFVGGLPSVREMFEGVLDLFVSTPRGVPVAS